MAVRKDRGLTEAELLAGRVRALSETVARNRASFDAAGLEVSISETARRRAC